MQVNWADWKGKFDFTPPAPAYKKKFVVGQARRGRKWFYEKLAEVTSQLADSLFSGVNF